MFTPTQTEEWAVIVKTTDACHKGQSQEAGPCHDRMAAAASGCCTCDRGAGHRGRCRCGTCGRWYTGGSQPERPSSEMA